MELHESLYALGRSQGRELFNDADSFRGALDDYLDEQSASTGDINLLVDAVRLGAFQSMATMLDSGADSGRAVADAGARLARDRGSSDVSGAMWACAALGYAIGKVSDADVRRYRTRHASQPAPPPAGPATVLPPASRGGPGAPGGAEVTQRPLAGGPSAPAPAWPNSGAGSGSAGAPPPFGSLPQPGPSYPQQYASFPAPGVPPKKKRGPLLPILLVVALVVLLVGGGVTAWLVIRDDDTTSSGGDDRSENTEDGGDLDFDAINERYESVAAVITDGATDCVDGDKASGMEEAIECTTPDGTMRLTTYSSEENLTAARVKVVDLDEGHLSAQRDSGYFYLYDDENVNDPDPDRKVSLYWDSLSGKQSVQITAGDGVDADRLLNAFRSTQPTVDEPTNIESSALADFADGFSISKCERIPTEYDGELEESKCRHTGNDVWVAEFESAAGFRDYRNLARRLTRDNGNLVNTYWYPTGDTTQTEQGKIFGYVDDSGNAVLYADDAECLCYFQAYEYKDGGVEGDPVALQREYFNVG